MFFCANESDYITFPLKTPQQLSILLGKRQNPFVCVRLSLSAGSPAPPAPPPPAPSAADPPAVLFLPTMGPLLAVCLTHMLDSSLTTFTPGHFAEPNPRASSENLSQTSLSGSDHRPYTLIATGDAALNTHPLAGAPAFV